MRRSLRRAAIALFPLHLVFADLSAGAGVGMRSHAGAVTDARCPRAVEPDVGAREERQGRAEPLEVVLSPPAAAGQGFHAAGFGKLGIFPPGCFPRGTSGRRREEAVVDARRG